MNLQSGRKSHQDLLKQAQQDLKIAETYVPCVSITEQNWKALIAELNAQIQVLEHMEQNLSNLTTRQELDQNIQTYLQSLTDQAESMKLSIAQFDTNLQNPLNQLNDSVQKILTDTEKQVGKMSEQFSQSLSYEKQRLRKHTVKLMLIALIPTVLLIAWELIRHFLLAP